MASKHRILIPPAWASHLADQSATDLKSATPPAISSPEYVSKLDATLTPEESAKLQELDPNYTVSEARLLARSSSTPPSPAGLLKNRENSAKRSSSSSDVPPENAKTSKAQNRDSGVDTASEVHTEVSQWTLLDRFWHGPSADDGKGQSLELQSSPSIHQQGRVFRALTGGDICVETVDVSQRVKLGPAVNEPNESLRSTHVGTKPDVKHQPSNYWGFSSKPDKLEAVQLDKDEPASGGVSSAPNSDQPNFRHCLSQKQNAEEVHDLPDSTTAPEDAEERDMAPWMQKRTSVWLKDSLHHPDTYAFKLTQFPGNTTGRRNSSPGNVFWRHQKNRSTPRPLTRHSLDHRYKTTVNDLENIMSSAVELAKEVMEHFESKSINGAKGGRARESHHQRTGSEMSGISRHKQADMRNDTIIVPVPQRISSLVTLGDVMDGKVKRASLAERLSLDGTPSDVGNFATQYNLAQAAADSTKPGPSPRPVHTHTMPLSTQDIELQERNVWGPDPQRPGVLNLRGRSHISLRGIQAFSLARSHARKPIARDWSDARKRCVASVACLSTALIGVLVGIYAGLVPSIQYYIVDLNHYAILGNVVFYFGLAIPSFFFWPLPLLHGRKPYILSGLVIALPLLFPQAVSVSQIRSPYTSQWR